MCSWNKIILLLFAFFLQCTMGSRAILAQDTDLSPTFQFELFDLPGGEVGSNVLAICQDTYGFMWYGSQYGLHRWDGYRFKTYLADSKDTSAISGNHIECLYIGKDGTLWLGVAGLGINRFDYETESFQQIGLSHAAGNNAASNVVQAITEDQEGHLWIGTDHGLFRMEISTGNIKAFLHDENDPHSLSDNSCRTVLVDREGALWVGTGYPWKKNQVGGLNRYRPNTEDFFHYHHDPKDPNSLINNKVTALFEDSKGNFWVGTGGDGLHLMDRAAGTFQRLTHDPNNPHKLSGPFLAHTVFTHIRFIQEDQHQNIWIGALLGGIACYNLQTGYIKNYFYAKNNPQSLPANNPWCFFQSKDGTFWASTEAPDGQVFKFHESAFEYYPIDNQRHKVYTFCEAKDQRVWIGTNASGLLQFDPQTSKTSAFPRASLQFNQAESNFKLSNIQLAALPDYFIEITEDKEGELWGTKHMPKGLFYLNPQTGKMRAYKHDYNDDQSIGRGTITDILRDKQDRMWMVTSRGDLNLYLPATNQFKRYPFIFPEDPSIHYGYNFRMIEDKEGKFWIVGTRNWGKVNPPVLFQFDPQTGVFTPFHDKLAWESPVFPNEGINNVLFDERGDLWLCSHSLLKKIGIQTGNSQEISVSTFGGLYFKSMVMDDQNRLWLYGDKITVYDPNTEKHVNFPNTFNVQPSTVNSQSLMKDNKGLIYVGGTGGFKVFNPHKLNLGTLLSSPETVLYGLGLLNQNPKHEGEKLHSFSLLNRDEIHLSFDENAFSLSFAALSFQHPESNRYQFKLEGHDKTWRPAVTEPIATYAKVPPGTYPFQVRSTSLQSEWGPAKTVIIHIAAPWWRTWWAYTLYLLAIASLLYAFYRIQLNKKLEQEKADRLEELNRAKTKLYTNITHEFRTPLTVIMGMADNIRGHHNERSLIRRNSENLLRLINQVLGLSKLESGTLQMDLIQGDIISYLRYLTESFHSMAEEKNLTLTFETEIPALEMDYDEAKIQHIMYNLFSNAIKFTEKGSIGLFVNQVTQGGSPFLQIEVRDSGIGMSEDQLIHIFDRFYQADSSSVRKGEGTGIGLALTQELVGLMEGSIDVRSSLETGTTFTLLLPIRRNAKTGKSAQSERVIVPESLKPVPSKVRPEIQKTLPILLLIEDNKDVTTYIEALLKTDYQVLTASNGQQGINIALEVIPDIIISDVMMPQKDGYEVCQALKSDERTSHIPIILLTAKATHGDRIEGLKGGADAYLTKPFNKEELFVRLEKLLALRKALQAFYAKQNIFSSKALAQKSTSLNDRFLQKLVKVVEERLQDADFSVSDLCDVAKLSNAQVNRKLKALTERTPSQFIRSIRLRKALELLQTTELNISEVAYDVGFNDPNYFSRSFSEEFGYPPIEARK